MSWWKFGHELGEQAEAGVEYTEIVPSRVIDTTSFLASELVSIVPSEPERRRGHRSSRRSASATRCSPRAPSSLYASRSCEAVPATTSCLGASPVTSPTVSPVMNDRSLSTAGKPGANWPVFAFHPAMKSWPPFW